MANPMAESIIEVAGLTKRFESLVAVDDVSFAVKRGEIFAFLGPNGAGKSTTIKMICTLLSASAGKASVAGFDAASAPRAVRRRIGLVFQERTLDDQLTAEENLRFHAVLYGVPVKDVDARIDRVLELVDLADRKKDLVSKFSGGMARRLEVARALLHTPEVLFLDEPTIGLDPQTRAKLWSDVLRLRKEEGVTVFFTTHYMDEAEYAERIAIIDHGKIVAIDTPTALKARIGADTVNLQTADDAQALIALRSAGYDASAGSPGVVVKVKDGEGEVANLVNRAKTPIRNVSVHRPSLDDVFMHFTGREMRPDAPIGNQHARAWMAMRRGR
ncbi:MAG: ATP-binding cassette domain-containing protein [Thermoplasmatota archaeon]